MLLTSLLTSVLDAKLSSVLGISCWILDTGFWVDSCFWYDSATWID